MNNFQRLSLEYDGIYGTLDRYTSDAIKNRMKLGVIFGTHSSESRENNIIQSLVQTERYFSTHWRETGVLNEKSRKNI